MRTDPSTWFLSRAERGNLSTDVHAGSAGSPAWSEGNLVVPLVHGTTYFARLHEELTALQAGDRVWFTDWRGDADERMLPDGPSIGDLLAGLARSGVEVRGLVWRSHGESVSAPMSGRSNERLGREINEAGGEVLLDQRVRLFGSHHQKFFVIRRRDDPSRDIAFVGGLDLCHGRRDDAGHTGDPQALDMDPRYGKRPPWHDASLELHGPVVADLLAVFAERWNDPHPLDRRTPYRMLLQRLARMPRHPRPLPESAPPPPPAGPHAVQLLRTYGVKRPPFPFAPAGERSIARAYGKAFARARSLIYIEDQYLWSTEVAAALAAALTRNPELTLIVVVPRYPDSDGRLAGPASRLGQLRALSMLRRAAPGRVGVFDLENAAGTPIYVHAKVCIVDDTWVTCGSDNFNRRSWTTDSELTCAVIDTTPGTPEAPGAGNGPDASGRLARDLRLQLWSEHLGLDPDDPALGDPAAALRLWNTTADGLDDWHATGHRATRPTGRVRHHTPEPVTRIQRLWAVPIGRFVMDPDGRPRPLRGTARF
ncbi:MULTISPECIES: phospholipase D family protein [Cryobacterium]|uniref:phospholipase D family protein n=1 Tax=Cryobacterium TaxID=69578 RepID=UPI00141A938F|nr:MULTISPECIES: phospholipase D-like domain-containing protein [Cryobacterium]MDY7527237.1 phospholipase D-like domain-containing protein [Cryobacterium sp. 10C2]MEB0002979.1 phospholipase D-like domain-containing protein [Cryobacterium sp. RTC2.1]MEB0201310.1 phospholipase D-like domain-containing protein [Cryobacterium sp. 5I3]MEB0285894.1 phospholipase D-like domain-containing protein [Cryobacterium sp. 10S3]MEB0290974.1 phospholipase D-like domain-containing protein [Cryobacterium sp. 10C